MNFFLVAFSLVVCIICTHAEFDIVYDEAGNNEVANLLGKTAGGSGEVQPYTSKYSVFRENPENATKPYPDEKPEGFIINFSIGLDGTFTDKTTLVLLEIDGQQIKGEKVGGKDVFAGTEFSGPLPKLRYMAPIGKFTDEGFEEGKEFIVQLWNDKNVKKVIANGEYTKISFVHFPFFGTDGADKKGHCRFFSVLFSQ